MLNTYVTILKNKSIHEIVDRYESSDFVRNCIAQFQKDKHSKIHVKGQSGPSISFLVSQLMSHSGNPILMILDDKEESAYLLYELGTNFNKDESLSLPGSYRRPYEIEETNNVNVVLCTDILNSLNGARKRRCIVIYAEGLFEKVVTRKVLSKNTLKISVGDLLDLDFLNETLFDYDFHRVDFVTVPDNFSFHGEYIADITYFVIIPF